MVKLPAGAKVLSVGRDCLGDMCLWAKVEPGNELVEVPLYIAYTGVDIPAHILDNCAFVGTVVEEFYVYHIFVERNWIWKEGYYGYVKRDGRINKKERSAGVVDTGGKPR